MVDYGRPVQLQQRQNVDLKRPFSRRLRKAARTKLYIAHKVKMIVQTNITGRKRAGSLSGTVAGAEGKLGGLTGIAPLRELELIPDR
ncbi:hypothetical protein FOZ62_026094 [Perkinsus olseni]|uniref:Uncharacterized protein n=1 Tax=Perkinsus olseni TaxID=32597 RepID=A0A7J6SSM7_PEROL|nr:hypothetical protein FOZ62_026094 [Perkinsus olseni]